MNLPFSGRSVCLVRSRRARVLSPRPVKKTETMTEYILGKLLTVLAGKWSGQPERTDLQNNRNTTEPR